MTAPKTFKRFAQVWFELFDKFKESPDETICVTLPDPKQAKAMRLEFYRARDAALADPDMANDYEAALNAREVKVRGNVCMFDSKDRNWVVPFITEALGGSDGSVTGSGHQ